jgi:AmmeMemoRadiSam system protein A
MAEHPLLQIARRAIAVHAEGRDARMHARQMGRSPPQACFVSLKAAGRLRGCIGTLQPSQLHLELEVLENALAAATRDPRFPPVRREEVARLHLSIDLLFEPEPVASAAELDPDQWGLIVREGRRCGVLLPSLPGVRTVEQQIGICREKAGIAADAAVTLERFLVRRIEE